jgi:putative protein-disulfide isomerase
MTQEPLQLLYIADPMCSWCYGFGPELEQVLDALPEAELDIMTGGLRAYEKEVLSAEKRSTIMEHWRQVALVSGLPFSDQAMAQTDFVYDTEPACRAVVTAKLVADHLSGRQLLQVFRAIQHAFYAEGRDVTQAQVLTEVCVRSINQLEQGADYDQPSFAETLASPVAMATVQEEFRQCQQWGVRGFPALLMVHDEALHMLTSGYTQAEQILQTIAQVRQS